VAGGKGFNRGILLLAKDLKRGANKDIGAKDIFEKGSI